MVRDKAFYKRLAMLALPMAGQNIISFMVGLGDNLMVSTLGKEAVGGIFVANQVQNILNMLVMGLGSALIIISTQYYGRQDSKAVKTLVAFALKCALVAGVIFVVLMSVFGRQVLGIFTDKPAVVEQALVYLRYMVWTYTFFCLTNTLLASLRSVGTVKVGLLVSSVILFIDLGLNYVMIFGKFGFPRMGVTGAALSTLIARIIEFCIVFFYVRFKDQKACRTLRS